MSLLDRFFADGNELAPHRARPPVAELEAGYRARAADGRGIAALPRNHRGRRWFYLFAWSDREGRELVELIRAWIGPALSDVQIGSLQLDADDPFDAGVVRAHRATAPEGRVVRVETLPRLEAVGDRTEAEIDRDRKRRERLLQLLRAAGRRPPSAFSGGRDTGTVLRDLRFAIGAGGIDRCRELLLELERSGDLDVPNLAFQEVRVLGGLRRWRELLDLPMLRDLLAMRRPPGVSRMIEEAAYRAELEEADLAGDDVLLVSRFAALADDLPGLGAGSPSPATHGQAVVQFLQAATVAEDRTWSERIIEAARAIDGGLPVRLERLAPDLSAIASEDAPVFTMGPAARRAAGDLEGAVAALDAGATPADFTEAIGAAVDLGTPEAADRVLRVVEDRLPVAGARGPVEGAAEAVRAAVEALRRAANETPRSWSEWFERCTAAGSATDAIAWLADRERWTPLPAAELLAYLSGADDSVRAALAHASGDLVDAHFERLAPTDQHEVLETLLLCLVLAGVATPAALDQAYALLELAVESDAPPSRLRSMAEAIGELLGAGSPKPEWMVDVLDLLVGSSVGGDAAAIVAVEQAMVALLRRTRRPVPSGLATRWRGLAEVAPLAGPPGDVAVDGPEIHEDLACLEGQRVGIYSLREAAARSVDDHLRRQIPGVEVVLNHDEKGSKALRDLADGCKVVVLVTVAATHSATDVLREARGSRPIEYVNRAGAAAILDALRDACRRSGGS